MKCIFCLLDKGPTDEHVFPRAIGGTLIIKRVCKDCNSKLGAETDVLLTDHPLTVMAASRYGLVDQKKQLTTIFGDGTLADELFAGQPIRVRLKPVPGDPAQGQPSMIPAPIIRPSVERSRNPDGSTTIKAQFDASDEQHARDLVRAELERLGHVMTDQEFEATFEAAVERQSVEHPHINHQIRIDLIKYRRAMMKMCYELAWYWLGDTWLDDPIAIQLREAILAGGSIEDFRGTCTIGATKSSLASIYRDALHVGMLIPAGGDIVVSVRVFDRFWACFVVSENSGAYFPASLISTESVAHGKVVGIFERDGPKESSFLDAIKESIQD